MDRDRGEPRCAAPPTPPGIGVTYHGAPAAAGKRPFSNWSRMAGQCAFRNAGPCSTDIPSTDRLPATVSAADVTRRCSRRPRYHAGVRLLMSCGRAWLLRASPTGPGPLVAAAGAMRPPRFRAKDVSTPMGSPTARGPSHTSPFIAWDDVAVSTTEKIGTLEMPVSQLNTQPMVSPVNASRQPARAAAHHSGPKRLAGPCSAVDFHLPSFAGLSWRSPVMATSGLSGHVAGTSALPL